ncbi:MAG: DUF4890 domain-containing protein [Prevotella sp.]|nr:DUF4890 domain-containing protein [Prevotella sp.]
MMKKTMMALVAAVMMSANMTAQTDEQTQSPQQPTMDKEQMIKERTEQMVKEYGLNEDQAEKLLVLNTEFAEKLPPMMGRGPQGMRRPDPFEARPQRQEGRRQAGEGRIQREETRRQAPDSMRMGRMRHQMGERPGMNREEMRKVMDEYQAGVEKIFTEEQFKKYKDNMQQRRRPMGQRGRRGAMMQQPQAPQQQQ